MNELKKHIERMMKPYREIVKITEPMRKIQEQWAEQSRTIQKAIEPTLELQKKLTEPLKEFQKSFENINRIYASIPKFQNPFLEHLETFKEIGERLKEYAKKTPEYFLLIAQHGWFIDLESDLNFPSRVANNIQENKVDVANELLIDYYKKNVGEIFESLIKRHYNRREILERIKNSFEEGNYTLLIPTALTQVDGICFDFTKKKFFIKEKKDKKYKFLPEVIAELEKSAGNFLELYLSPLQNQTPIMAREQDIGKFPCKLNRHEILHGIRTDYGTEVNSLKVISLLKYVSDLLTDLDNKTLSTTKNIVHLADSTKI
ncbi:MAG: hypothetical protein KJ578_03805 [Bacteroidetes bacterium]|nr:hypothetical protein [Bacteroidota bacterium]MBU1579139.1 hypothetical protein [Bacteroidota bacterium]MBU2556885.1 hypothetical protein [Bacteroidota bacterium]